MKRTKNLDHAYCYYDNRSMKTNYAQASFDELKIAYTKITSGGTLKLWLYLLHKISGRTPYDREYKERLPYRLGIQQIETHLSMSRASIYRAFGDLKNNGLIQKLKLPTKRETDNVVCFLTIPNFNNENETEKKTTNTNMVESQNCDPPNQQNHAVKGNSSELVDLNFDTMIQEHQKPITPLTPHEVRGEKKNNNEKVLKGNSQIEDFSKSQLGNKDTNRKQEIDRICIALMNIRGGMIPDRDFSNVLSDLKRLENVSTRKTWVRKAIQIYNKKIEVQTHVTTMKDNAHAQGEILQGGGEPSDEEQHRKQEYIEAVAFVEDFTSKPYNKFVHDSLFLSGSWFGKFPDLMKKLRDWRDNAQKKPPVVQVDEWIEKDIRREIDEQIINPFTTKTEKPTDIIKNLTDKFTKDK